MSDARAKRKAQKPVRSLRKLAAACGVSVPAASKWHKHPAWPFGNGPFPVDEVQAWRARVLQEDRSKSAGQIMQPRPGDLDTVTKAKVGYIVARTKKVLRENEILNDKYVPREDHERNMVEKINLIKAAMLAIPRNVAAAIGACKSDDERADVLAKRIELVFNEFYGESH